MTEPSELELLMSDAMNAAAAGDRKAVVDIAAATTGMIMAAWLEAGGSPHQLFAATWRLLIEDDPEVSGRLMKKLQAWALENMP